MSALLVLAATAAFADAEEGAIVQMREACRQSDAPQTQIDACTTLIKALRPQGRELAQALYHRGVGYAAKTDYANAVRDFTQALKFAPNSTDALYNRGGAYTKLGQWDDALADFNALLAIVPNDPDSFYARAWVHAQRGDDKAAIADLDRVLSIAPDDQEALLDRGGMSIRAGRYDDAIRDFGQLLKLDPKAAAAAYNRGRAYYAKQDFKNAAADFALALKLRADNPYAALRLYLAQSHLGKGDAAVLKKGIDKLDPSIWPRPLLELFTGTGEDPALIAGINELPSTLRTDVLCEAQYYLGERALLKGDKRKARDYFAAAAGAASTTTERIDAKAALARVE
ncbi:tetratricopeptide repeat protein [Dongia deserti]|uniref:tetratricopeptide repeat protein n=1 Tax=Dongia deserti TaxID=2268030 RepID=UPI0013C521AA|nr:tetratricopeptide repeat protein [Dongia deserti]